MIDHYLWGSSDRISPEAPVPVALISDESKTLGGAGNVVKNLVALKSNVDLLSVVGECNSSTEIRKMLKEIGIKDKFLIKEPGRTPSVKSRIIIARQQVIRFDKEDENQILKDTEQSAIKLFKKICGNYDLILISDYGKGLLTSRFTKEIISFSNKINKKVIVDPKGDDYSKYKNAYLLTPNKKEASVATNISIKDKRSLIKSITKLKKDCNLKYSLITLSEDGIALYKNSLRIFPTFAQEVFDVTGAGDTVIASLGHAIANENKIEDCIYFSNLASGVVIAKLGSSSASMEEIFDYESKITKKDTGFFRNYKEISDITNELKNRGKKVVFTNGCFDILHIGHVKYLKKARKLGDLLIVGINSNNSVKKLKGKNRPINDEIDRAEVLLGLKSVDYVVIFKEETPLRLINKIQPNILAKGGDYKGKRVVGDEVADKLVIIDFEKGKSTTNVIEAIKQEKNE